MKTSARIVRCGITQVSNPIAPKQADAKLSREENLRELAVIKEAMIRKHEKITAQAAKKKVQILCFQEIFTGPYFCAEHNQRWYALAEPVPGPTTQRFAKLAKQYKMVLVLPVYEKQMTGVYYNTAAVIDADGRYLGKFRKIHIPQVAPGFHEKFYFKPGNLGHPVFKTKYAAIGIYICYDRHFVEGPRILGLNGAEILFNPSATIEGVSKYLWEIEQPAAAVANGVFIGANNRVGIEKPWRTGKFYGSSYFVNPRGRIIAQAGDRDALVVADLDLDMIRQVRNAWQFYRDRRPECYGDISALVPKGGK